MRGKCRYCAHSLTYVGPLWFSEWEYQQAELCWPAPQRPCPACTGSGEVYDPKAFAGQGGMVPCGICSGGGFLPGFHWPWRQPPPPDVA